MTPPAKKRAQSPRTQTALSLVDGDLAALPVDAVVLGVHRQGDELLLTPGAQRLADAFDGRLAETLRLLGATGAPNEVTKVATLGALGAPLLLAVGLGPRPADGPVAAEVLRRAAASAVRALAGAAKVALALPLPEGGDALRGVAEGALLGAYQFAGYKTGERAVRKPAVGAVQIVVGDAKAKAAKAELARAAVVAAAVTRARDLVNTAPNDKRPPAFAETVAAAAAEAGLGVEVLDEKALKKGGFGGILAVGLGSAAAPRLVKLSYAPSRRKNAPRVALVGKGITFDSGGLSIKPSAGMWEMKSDMAGAAAVASVMIAVAALKPDVAVTAYLPMAENMPSATAYRPGDVVTMRGGKRVEVHNTDAEGRMLLADAIVAAGEDGCDFLVETSTLTGGQVTALGKRISGVMGDPEFCQRVKAAGEAAGEPMWPMPLPEEVRKGMDSEIADICQINASGDRAGHMLQGGAFLSEFVPADVPWAHIDIAGPSFHTGEPTGYFSKGGTGVPVRTLLALLEDLAG